MKNKIIAFLTAIIFVLGLFLALQFVAQSVKDRNKSIRFIQNDFEDIDVEVIDSKQDIEQDTEQGNRADNEKDREKGNKKGNEQDNEEGNEGNKEAGNKKEDEHLVKINKDKYIRVNASENVTNKDNEVIVTKQGKHGKYKVTYSNPSLHDEPELVIMYMLTEVHGYSRELAFSDNGIEPKPYYASHRINSKGHTNILVYQYVGDGDWVSINIVTPDKYNTYDELRAIVNNALCSYDDL